MPYIQAVNHTATVVSIMGSPAEEVIARSQAVRNLVVAAGSPATAVGNLVVGSCSLATLLSSRFVVQPRARGCACDRQKSRSSPEIFSVRCCAGFHRLHP